MSDDVPSGNRVSSFYIYAAPVLLGWSRSDRSRRTKVAQQSG